jgi:hypothetical protein
MIEIMTVARLKSMYAFLWYLYLDDATAGIY